MISSLGIEVVRLIFMVTGGAVPVDVVPVRPDIVFAAGC